METTPRPTTLAEIAAAARRGPARAGAAAVLAAVISAITLIRVGWSANAVAWAAVQVVLVFIAWFDVQTRRILNVVVAPLTAVALLLRVASERDELLACALAGLVAAAVFFLLNLITRGGLGMGDVKLAGAIGVLLGVAGATALVLGTLLGGTAAVLMIVRGAGRRSTLAYGPYLCAGAALVILAGTPPPLI